MDLEGRVAIVTGGGRGIGRAEALRLAAEGARVLVNDLGCGPDGRGADPEVAQAVVDEIVDAGGDAAASTIDVVASGAPALLARQALDRWERIDILVNNAGFLRDWQVVNLTPEDWDAILHVHLRVPFLLMKELGRYWRAQARSGKCVEGRIINTTSGSGMFGNRGQSNYAAAKAGIIALTLVSSMEMHRFGVTVNAIAPMARTTLTAPLIGIAPPADVSDVWSPANIAPLVAYLASSKSQEISGQIFGVWGGEIELYEGWHVAARISKGARWNVEELDRAIGSLFADAPSLYDRSLPNPEEFGWGIVGER